MKKVKGLTVANIRNIEGLERREDLDFRDDGSTFRGFEYKGLPITQCRYNGECYLSIRYDYVDNAFTWEQWHEQPESKLAEEFNGVKEFDLDKLVENCEKVAKAIETLNNEIRNRDYTDEKVWVKEKIEEEKDKIINALNEAKTKVTFDMVRDWTNWDLDYFKHSVRFLENMLERLNNINIEDLDAEHLNRYTSKGWVELYNEEGNLNVFSRR